MFKYSRNPDIPARERLAIKDTVVVPSWRMPRMAGSVLLSAVEGAIDGAVASAGLEIEGYRLEHAERVDTEDGVRELEAHVNSSRTHKDI